MTEPAVSGAQHLEQARFTPVPGMPDSHSCTWRGATDATVAILVTFDATGYPLERHCRYAVPEDESAPHTFTNLHFNESPPGTRVGPWPGWRGIPPMPDALLRANGRTIPLRFEFWGDEFHTGRYRAVARMRGDDRQLLLTSADARLVPLHADFFAVNTPTVRPEPLLVSPRNAERHPRLLLCEEDLPRLRDLSSERRRLLHHRLHDLLANWDISLRRTEEAKIPPGPEGLAPEDRLLLSAYVAMLEPGTATGDRARSAFHEYLELTERQDFEPLSIDTQCGEVLFLLCVGYDWIFAVLSDHERERASQQLSRVVDLCWGHLGYERSDFAQAHYLGCGLGLLAYSLLFPEHPRAEEWRSHCHGVIRWVCSVLPSDGFHPHGINMWIYEFGFLLRWMELIRSAGGRDLWPSYPALAAASRFRAATSSTDGLLGVTMGDPQYRVGGDSWQHYLIASRTGSREAQWFGNFGFDLPIDGVDYRLAPARRRVYEHLWYNPLVEAHRPDDSIDFFQDGGQVVARKDRSLFTFRSGHPLGKSRYNAGILGGYGHSDPCNGSFLVAEEGSLLISGGGPVYRRDSALHNVVTIDGRGQIGDSTVWLPDFLPPSHIPHGTEIRVDGTLLSIAAETSPAHLPDLDLSSLRRNILVSPGRFIVGLDQVRLTRPRSVEWNIHSWFPFNKELRSEIQSWRVGIPPRILLRVFLFAPWKVEWWTGKTVCVPAYPHDGRVDYHLQVRAPGETIRFVWCLLWPGCEISRVINADGAEFQFDDGIMTAFDGTWLSRRRDG